MISTKIMAPTVIGNCRSVLAFQTDISVVHMVLVNIKKMLNIIGQDLAIITCDEGVYSLTPHSHQMLSCLKSGVSYSSTVSLPINQE